MSKSSKKVPLDKNPNLNFTVIASVLCFYPAVFSKI